MLAFAVEHGVKPQVEVMPLARINEALDRVPSSAVPRRRRNARDLSARASSRVVCAVLLACVVPSDPYKLYNELLELRCVQTSAAAGSAPSSAASGAGAGGALSSAASAAVFIEIVRVSATASQSAIVRRGRRRGVRPSPHLRPLDQPLGDRREDAGEHERVECERAVVLRRFP